MQHSGFSRRLSLRTKGVLVVLLPSLAFVAAGAGFVVAQRSASHWQDRVAQNAEIHRTTDQLLQLLTDAETGVRGYVAVQDPSFLVSEDAARVQLPDVLARLTTASPSGGAAQVRKLEVLANRELAGLEELEELVAQGSADSPRVRQLLLSGKAIMGQVRLEQAHLVAMEQASADAAQREHRRWLHRLNVTSGALLLLGLLGGVGAAAALMGRIVTRIRFAERSARALAVGEAVPRPANPGSDEVGSLVVALGQAADLIAEERRRFGLALEVGQINIWTVDDSGRMTVHGDRSSEYGGTHESALVFFNATDAQRMRDVVAGVLSDGAPRVYEIEHRENHRRFAGRAVRLSATEVLGASIDVTALREAQEEARQAEARRAAQELAASEQRARHNAAILGSAGEGIVTADAHDVCTSVNPAAARMLGYEVHELVGRSLHPLIHHSHPDGSPYQQDSCPMMLTIASGRSHRVEHEVFWRRDGSRLPVEYTASPLTQEGRESAGVVVTFVDATVRRQTNEQLERDAAELRAAVDGGDLVLHYQPKMRMISGRVHSVEALVRWRRGESLVYPDAFIPLAEETGVIGDLTRWVLSEAAAQAGAWRSNGLDLRIAVNLSGASLTDDRVIERLVSATEAHGLPPSQLEVELTETAVAADPDAAVRTLTQLARLGVHRAIDDFGTGYSSLSYLKHLPVSEIKIDKSFVMNMPQDARDRAIVKATVEMAQSLGLTTTAEGVENETVREMAARAGCHYGQGYLWSKPVSSTHLVTWLRQRDLGSVENAEPSRHGQSH